MSVYRTIGPLVFFHVLNTRPEYTVRELTRRWDGSVALVYLMVYVIPPQAVFGKWIIGDQYQAR